MNKVFLITNKSSKLLAAQDAFKDSGIKLEILKGDFPEIQSNNSIEIAKYTALQAAKDKNINVIREDHSLYINELGFPGPYTKFIESALPAEKLVDLLKKDFTGYFEICAVYAEPSGFFKEFSFKVPIKLSKELKGNKGNWNRVLMLKDSNKTFAESAEEEFIPIFNKNFVKISKFLVSRI